MSISSFTGINNPNPFSNGVPGFPSTSAPIKPKNNNSLAEVANPASKTVADELSNLQELSLTLGGNGSAEVRTVTFPGLLFREEQTKNLILHRYPHQDGAAIENMGANPTVYNIKAILTNNIYPGKKETWIAGTLFPTVFNRLLSLLDNNAPLTFAHPNPEIGNQNVQVRRYSYEFNPKGPRDGAFVDIELIVDSLQVGFTDIMNFLDLDASLKSLDNAIIAAPLLLQPPGLTLAGFFNKIAAITNAIVSTPSNYINAINASIVSNIDRVSGIAAGIVGSPAFTVTNILQNIQATKSSLFNSSIEYAVNYDETTFAAVKALLTFNNTPSSNATQFFNKLENCLVALQSHYINQNNSAAAPLIRNTRQSLFQVQAQNAKNSQSAFNPLFNQNNKKINTYVTLTDVTWMQLANILNNNIDDLLALNKNLLNTNSSYNSIWIRKNTTIKYYQA